MSEYIEREGAYPLAKKICDAIDSKEFQRLNFGMRILDWIDDIPTADVRPVARCRECKHNYNTCFNHGINQPMCDFTDRKLREDDFCSHGEKREES